jgi:hypothetical protein
MAANVTLNETSAFRLDASLWGRGRSALIFCAIVSWVASIAGYLWEPDRFFWSYLVGFLFSTMIALGAMFFVMVQYLTGSAWSVPMRRFMESMMVTIPVGALLFIPIAFGIHNLYEWSHTEVVAKDHILQGKAGYLNPQWFTIRAGIYFLIWTVWALAIYRASTKQDRTKSLEQMHTASRWSAPGLLFVFLSVSLAAFDWIMSLDPHWYSTIFGIYVFAGGGWSFFAALTLICLGLRQAGILDRVITVEHYHDMGKWMFALTVFWSYIAFSQYLLIWYGNLPEETIFFKHRMEGSWGGMSLLLLLGHFILPFIVLLPRRNKRNLKVLLAISVWILLIQYVDLYWLIMPNFQKHGVQFHWLDLATLAAVASVYGVAFWGRLKNHPLLPVGDPRFEQGLHFKNL